MIYSTLIKIFINTETLQETSEFPAAEVINKKNYFWPKLKRTPASISKRRGWMVRRERGWFSVLK